MKMAVVGRSIAGSGTGAAMGAVATKVERARKRAAMGSDFIFGVGGLIGREQSLS
jgi:hypothetical protein